MAKKRTKKKPPPRSRFSVLSTSEKWRVGGAASAIFVGWTAFLYQMAEMLRRHTDWNTFYTPPGVAEILTAVFFASIAFGGALFSDFGKLLALIRGQPFNRTK